METTATALVTTPDGARQIGFISYQHHPRELSEDFLDFVLDEAYALIQEYGVHIAIRGLYA